MPRLWLLVCAVAVAGCRCDGGPATGECTGTWGGASISAAIDADSRFVIIYPETCAGVSLRIYEIGWGEGRVKATFQPNTYPSIISGELSKTVPNDFSAFSLEPTVTGAAGTVKLKLEGIYGRRTGSIEMTAGAESLTCTFNLPYETEGTKPKCSSGGGGYDFD